jgi:hypothetical protein
MNRRIFSLSKSGLFDYLSLEQIETLCKSIRTYTNEKKLNNEDDNNNNDDHNDHNLICRLVLNECMSIAHREPDENSSEFWKDVFMDLCRIYEQIDDPTHQNTVQEAKIAVARYYFSKWELYGTREEMQEAYQKLEQEALTTKN